MNLYDSNEALTSTKLSDKSGELNNRSHSPSIDDTLSPLPSATWYNSLQKKNSKSIEKQELLMSWNGFLGIPQSSWNIFFVFLVVFGQVGQNVSLPIWFASSPTKIDPLFILTFAGFSFICIFGCLTLIDICNGKTSIAECRRFTSTSFVFRYCSIGICNALNGILLVFAAKSTAAYLQSILGTFNIAWTMLFRFLILQKRPSFIQFIYAVGVFAGLFLASAPVIFNLTSKNSFSSDATGVWKWLWPMIFGVSFAPAAVMNVVAEHVLKDSSSTKSEQLMVLRLNDDSDNESSAFVPITNVNVWYYLTMQSIVQELTFILFFWVDAIPTFGSASNISGIFLNIKQDWRYFFAMDGATAVTSIRALVFVACYAVNFIGSSLMLRYTEGATLTAIVGALVSPLGAIFWILFCLCGKDKNVFMWESTWESSDLWVIGGLVIMSIFIFLYDYHSHKAVADSNLATEIEKTKISNARGYVYQRYA